MMEVFFGDVNAADWSIVICMRRALLDEGNDSLLDFLMWTISPMLDVAAIVPSLLRRPIEQVRYRHGNMTRMMSLLVC